jgi:hypothetical protein
VGAKRNNKETTVRFHLWSAATASVRDMILWITTSSGILCFLLVAKRYF